MEYREKQSISSAWMTKFSGKENQKERIGQEGWKRTDVPHNWEDYQGYRQLSHGNLHGTAWYFREIEAESKKLGEHVFLEFEGAGSYLTVWCNGREMGRHAGGRTACHIEITDALHFEEKNQLLVRTEHPEKIMDLPWVCGGCWGTPNTEGSQPLGIFRPVWIYRTGAVRIAPCGVGITAKKSREGWIYLKISAEIQNLGNKSSVVSIRHRIMNPSGDTIEVLEKSAVLSQGERTEIYQESRYIEHASLWSPKHPDLYFVETEVQRGEEILDRTRESFGIRFLTWENFETEQESLPDKDLLNMLPSEENLNFMEFVKNPSNARVTIVPGSVKVRLPGYQGESCVIEIETIVRNEDTKPRRAELESFVQTYNRTKSIADLKQEITLKAQETKTIVQRTEALQFLDVWSEERPYYHLVTSTVRETDEALREAVQAQTPFAVLQAEGSVNRAYPYKTRLSEEKRKKHRLLVNQEPVFLQGTCEYEHLLGGDHAFADKQIEARMKQIQSAGFNAFREAHCPHNLRYVEYCDRNGLLYWAQMGAHLYFDNEDFRENFLNLTREWVRERRNSPSVILWGIQNESMLPESFAVQVRTEIMKLDETVPQQRKTTTCNGGSGSDWDVPQNWTGTYGGSVETYGKEAAEQLLIGEYGQYRVFGKHEEGEMESRQNSGGDVSEELFCYCLQTKLREMYRQNAYSYGHFQWIFNAHANPGRETLYCLDGQGTNRIGVVNSKGLLTSWGEPVDAFYMYRSHLVSAENEPMVYIVSHSWQDRFLSGARRADITVYSNCDYVELYNDFGQRLCAESKRGIFGKPFVFRDIMVEKGILYAKGYYNGMLAAEDWLLLEGLPFPEDTGEFFQERENLTLPGPGEYLFRINCGGKAYVDCNGNEWSEDASLKESPCGWHSWGMEYENLPDDFGSVRRNLEPIRNSRDQELFQTYRYGREKLWYYFPVPDGEYIAELYFVEPWYGLGGGMDCTGWRVFDVAVNGETVLRDFDIWKEAKGCFRGIRKEAAIRSKNGGITVSFPKVKSYQAILCAIAVRKAENTGEQTE